MVKALLIGLAIVGATVPLTPASPSIAEPGPFRSAARPYACPADLPALTELMVRDLPAYINRVYARSVKPQTGGWSYAIAVGQPEFEPLPVGSREALTPADPSVDQVFFTVLERQYFNRRATDFQQYHWLFLTRTASGWQLALMFSRIGSYPSDRAKPLTPPRESSQGLTAQAVRLWLRDCQAGAIPPLVQKTGAIP